MTRVSHGRACEPFINMQFYYLRSSNERREGMSSAGVVLVYRSLFLFPDIMDLVSYAQSLQAGSWSIAVQQYINEDASCLYAELCPLSHPTLLLSSIRPILTQVPSEKSVFFPPTLQVFILIAVSLDFVIQHYK